MFLAIWVKFMVINTFKRHFYYIENTSLKYFIKINIRPSLLFNQITRFLEIKLVTFFQFSIVIIILLNSIIGQVDKWLINALLTKSEFMRTGSNVTFFE